jgi:GPH family glycoside/pentoside/hexuronide:cation symporter
MAAFFLLTGMVLRSTLAIYYVKYFLGKEELITQFITIGMIGNILGCACASQLAKRVDKIKAYISLQIISAVICLLSFFISSEQTTLAMVMYFLWGFFLQMATPLLWAKMADAVDYGHWKTGIRITGMVYSAVVFFIKMGLALGGAIAGWLLAYYGYQADMEQTPQAMQGILLSFTVFPAIGSILVAIIMRWYTLDNEKLEQIHREIDIVSA